MKVVSTVHDCFILIFKMISYVKVLIEMIPTPLFPNSERLMCTLHWKKLRCEVEYKYLFLLAFLFCGNLFLMVYK